MNENCETRALEVLQDFPEVLFCSIYGSMAGERWRKDSDLDVAIAGDRPMPTEKLAELSLKLSDACHREVDLIDLQANSGVILQQVLCEGKIILKKSVELYAALIRKMWYNQADEMPNVRMIWEQRRKRVNGANS